MPIFTTQEKLVIRFIVISAILGLAIGVIRTGNIISSKNDIPEFSAAGIIEIDSVSNTSISRTSNNRQIGKEKSTEKTSEIVNINSATKAELMALPKIGPVTAERIIQYREDFGKFSSLQDLTNVKGIGPKTLDRLKPFIMLE